LWDGGTRRGWGWSWGVCRTPEEQGRVCDRGGGMQEKGMWCVMEEIVGTQQ